MVNFITNISKGISHGLRDEPGSVKGPNDRGSISVRNFSLRHRVQIGSKMSLFCCPVSTGACLSVGNVVLTGNVNLPTRLHTSSQSVTTSAYCMAYGDFLINHLSNRGGGTF
jgi:hypothetical protein